MTRFGDALRQERETRGVAVAEICATTKISVQHVLSLEADEFKQLPGGVFRRGILRGYLGALGLEERPWLERFEMSCREAGLDGVGELDWVRFAENVKRGRNGEQQGTRWRWAGVVVLMVSLCAIAFIAWQLVRHHKMAIAGVLSG